MFEGIAMDFKDHYRFVIADTPALRTEAFKIRHTVYCDELEWEPKNALGLETDSYDSNSIQLLLYHSPSDQYVACTRSVYVDQDDPRSKIPFELHLEEIHALGRIPIDQWKRETFVETSRVSVPNALRKYQADSINNDLFVNKSHISVILCWGSLIMQKQLGLMGHSFGVMEWPFVKHLKRGGMLFEQASEFFEHRGQRAVFHTNWDMLSQNRTTEIDLLVDLIGKDFRRPDFESNRPVA